MTTRMLKICLAAGAAAIAVPVMALAADAAKAPISATEYLKQQAAKKDTPAPRAPDGHLSLEGDWTNASLTRLERQAQYGDRLKMTDDEVKKAEGATAAVTALSLAPTDPNATVKDLPADCSGGRVTNCNYNAAWTDPGELVMRVNGEARTSFITYPTNGRVPLKAGAAPARGGRGAAGAAGAAAAARPAPARGGGGGESGDEEAAPPARRLPAGVSQNDNPEGRSLGERCLTSFGNSSGPVMQPLLYNNTYQFVQTKDEVAILVEMVHDVRHIRLNTKEHLPASVRPWMGDSIGWWEGNTLVAETTNFNPQAPFRGASANLKVTERFTRLTGSRMKYEFRVEDPTVFSEPWGGEYEFRTSQGPVYEYACHEGNYGLVGILAGARAEEEAAKARTASAGRAGSSK